jgi:glyoxylase-like metal-dependent hydrolase (beta-lactamase superfamily II)
MKVIPLIQGVHAHQQTNAGVFLPGHTGAVTLVKSDARCLLVDTGGRGTWHRLERLLNDHDLSPKDIDTVVLTHLHLDHSFNVCRFPRAIVLAWNHDWRETGTLRLLELERVSPLPGVRLIRTPGHAPEHLSVVVAMDDGTTTVIAGDAIEPGYNPAMPPTSFCCDAQLYRESADRILAIADDVIPGHGAPFTTRKA